MFIIAHNIRHIKQAERAIAVAQTFSSKMKRSVKAFRINILGFHLFIKYLYGLLWLVHRALDP
jgi:hypothetical protein